MGFQISDVTSTTTIDINGRTFKVNWETTSSQNITDFIKAMQIFQEFSQPGSTITNQVAAARMQTALAALQNLLNGSSSSVKNYLNLYTAQAIQALAKTLKNAGFSDAQIRGEVGLNPEDAAAWRKAALAEGPIDTNTPSTTPIKVALKEASGAASSNAGIQSLIETQYVQSANNILATQLSNLQGALATTQDVLTNLGNLQQLHNQIAVSNLSTFNFNYATATGSAAYIAAFQSAANKFFNSGVISPALPSALIGGTGSVPAGDAVIPMTPTALSDYKVFYNLFKKGILTLTTMPSVPPITSVNIANPDPPVDIDQALLAKYGFFSQPGNNNWSSANNFNSQSMFYFVTQPRNFVQVGSSVLGYTINPAGDDTGKNFNSAVNGTQSALTPATISIIKYDAATNKYTQTIALPTALQNAIDQLIQLRTAISGQLVTLRAQTPASALNNPNTLLARMSAVYLDIKNNFAVSTHSSIGSQFIGFQSWALDNYNKRNSLTGNLAGSIQQDITFAVTAGQNLNDTQQQQVQSSLFLFEEYYKSASALLTKISQIIERMAQGVVR